MATTASTTPEAFLDYRQAIDKLRALGIPLSPHGRAAEYSLWRYVRERRLEAVRLRGTMYFSIAALEEFARQYNARRRSRKVA